MAISSKMQEHDDQFFFEPSILNIGSKYNIKEEHRRIAFNYGICSTESGYDGKEENHGMLVLRIVTVKYPTMI